MLKQENHQFKSQKVYLEYRQFVKIPPERFLRKPNEIKQLSIRVKERLETLQISLKVVRSYFHWVCQ